MHYFDPVLQHLLPSLSTISAPVSIVYLTWSSLSEIDSSSQVVMGNSWVSRPNRSGSASFAPHRFEDWSHSASIIFDSWVCFAMIVILWNVWPSEVAVSVVLIDSSEIIIQPVILFEYLFIFAWQLKLLGIASWIKCNMQLTAVPVKLSKSWIWKRNSTCCNVFRLTFF